VSSLAGTDPTAWILLETSMVGLARSEVSIRLRSARHSGGSRVDRGSLVAVLEASGGELDAEEAFSELEILLEDRLLPWDRQTTPTGEPRWQYAARRARVALIDEGLMTKGVPGVWTLAKAP
jgi:hypothetical protein